MSSSLSYTEQGRGAALVLLHGFPLDRRMWNAQVSALSQKYRVITPDLRGFGQSESTDSFSIESLADDLHRLLETVGAISCVLAGLSMGGYVSLAYAKKYASDLRGLALVDTKADADTLEGKQGREKMIELARSSGSKAIAEQMMPKMLSAGTLQNRPEIVKSLRDIMEACPSQTIQNALAAMRDRPDRSSELPQIKVPTLVIVGDADSITPPDVSEKMAKAIPSAKLEIIRGAGHMSPMEQPEQVNRALEQFMGSL